jgi:molecular chaperone GrpE
VERTNPTQPDPTRPDLRQSALALGLNECTFPLPSFLPASLACFLQEAKEQGNGAPEEAGEAEVAEGEPEDNVVEELRARITSMDAELKAAKDRVAYALAEMENVRNIARRDAESGRKFAVQSFAKSLLDVADNLEMAIAAVPEEEASSPGVATLLEGVKMTESNLQKTFAKQGLVRFGVVGDKFDPHLHDAMFTYEDASAEKGTVGQVLKPGYQLHDRVIRAAQVGIIKE